MEIERYRTITIDLANDYTPLVRLNAGDSNGRILRFNVTDGGGDVDDLHGLTGKFTWNRNPGGGTAGGYAETTVATGSDTANGVRTVSFTAPVPPAMLADAGDRLTFGLDIMDADQNIIASRNIDAIVEPARINANAPEILDPLKDLHNARDLAQQAVTETQKVIAGAGITAGTTPTLKPSQKVTSSLGGSGLQRTLSLGLPRGSHIIGATATPGKTANDVAVAMDTNADGDTSFAVTLPRGRGISQVNVAMLATGATPTADTSENTAGDLTVNLGIPRGEKGDGGTIATTTTPGIVKPGKDFGVFSDGELYLKSLKELWCQYGLFDYSFNVSTVTVYHGMGSFSHAHVTLWPNTLYSGTIRGSVTLPVLPDAYRFDTLYATVKSFTQVMPFMKASPASDGTATVQWAAIPVVLNDGAQTITLDLTPLGDYRPKLNAIGPAIHMPIPGVRTA